MDRDERLMAYVDGELGDPERVAFEQDLATDPELQRQVARQRELRRRLSAAFDPVLDEAVPLSLRLTAEAANAPGARSWRAPQWAAMAACLALGVLLGRAVLPEHGLLAERNGTLILRGQLAQALDQRLASEAAPIRVGLSFQSQQGAYCRTFQSAPDRLAGVACRSPQGWAARTVTAWSPQQGPAYRPAGSETPPAVLAAVDELIAGEPLDAAAERAARDRGWKER